MSRAKRIAQEISWRRRAVDWALRKAEVAVRPEIVEATAAATGETLSVAQLQSESVAYVLRQMAGSLEVEVDMIQAGKGELVGVVLAEEPELPFEEETSGGEDATGNVHGTGADSDGSLGTADAGRDESGDPAR